MGACTFRTISDGRTAKEAFVEAVREAQYEYGHGGYTGTIAEKSDFVMVATKEQDDAAAHAYADSLLEMGDPRISDKWGPAGCIPLAGEQWLFFGWASE